MRDIPFWKEPPLSEIQACLLIRSVSSPITRMGMSLWVSSYTKYGICSYKNDVLLVKVELFMYLHHHCILLSTASDLFVKDIQMPTPDAPLFFHSHLIHSVIKETNKYMRLAVKKLI